MEIETAAAVRMHVDEASCDDQRGAVDGRTSARHVLVNLRNHATRNGDIANRKIGGSVNYSSAAQRKPHLHALHPRSYCVLCAPARRQRAWMNNRQSKAPAS